MAEPAPVPVPEPQTTAPELAPAPTPAPIPNGTAATSADVDMVDSQPIKTEVRVPHVVLPFTVADEVIANTSASTSHTYTCHRTRTLAQFTAPQ